MQEQEVKTEVMKLGSNMSKEDREALHQAVEEAKKNATEEGLGTDEVESRPQEPEKSPCPVCGHDGKEKQQPSNEDLEEFMRATLGCRRFTKPYQLMKGNIAVQFSTIDTVASERMNKVIAELTAVEDINLFRAYISKLQLIYMLSSYTLGDGTVSFSPSEADSLEAAEKDFLERFGKLDESIVGIFVRSLNSFVNLKVTLAESCFDENFYKGAGPF